MILRQFLAALALGLLATGAAAQYPSKPIRIVVPLPAGTASDFIARVLGQSVSQSVGQPVIVENRPGADGAIGAMEVVKAAPDGHTLLLGSPGPIASVPALRKQPPYDPLADLTPVADIGRFTLFLLAHPSVPAKTFRDLVGYAKANPGKLAYATGNTSGIVSFAQLTSLTGTEMVQVPYKGEPAGITDLVEGRVQLMIATPTTSLPHVQSGRLKPLAVLLPKRSGLLPEVPTLNEAGLPSFTITSFAALYGPGKMPRELTERVNREFVAAMKRPEVAAALEKQAVVLNPSTPDELAAFTVQQVQDFRRILREAGVQPE
jgi:tripartite-type tricarboxylate transporter receptor subunit TctC